MFQPTSTYFKPTKNIWTSKISTWPTFGYRNLDDACGHHGTWQHGNSNTLDLCGKLVGTYTSPMNPMGLLHWILSINSGWWLNQPILKNMIIKLDHFPNFFRGEHVKNYLSCHHLVFLVLQSGWPWRSGNFGNGGPYMLMMGVKLPSFPMGQPGRDEMIRLNLVVAPPKTNSLPLKRDQLQNNFLSEPTINFQEIFLSFQGGVCFSKTPKAEWQVWQQITIPNIYKESCLIVFWSKKLVL